MKLIAALIFLVLVQKIECKVTPLIDGIRYIGVGILLTQRLLYDDGETIKTCILNSGNVNLTIPMDKIEVMKGELLTDRIVSLGDGCAFRMGPMNETDPSQYYIYTDYVLGDGFTRSDRLSFQLLFTDYGSTGDASRVVTYGSTVTLPINYRIDKGTLYDPKGDLVPDADNCNYIIKSVLAEHIGVWTCNAGSILLSGGVTHKTNIILDGTDEIKTWYREEGNFGVVGCQYSSLKVLIDEPAPDLCNLLRPDGYLLTVSTGSATERYTTAGTDFDKWICQIEFKLPLLASEVGTWMCRFDKVGGFIYTQQSAPDYIKFKSEMLKIGSAFEISCQVPYSSDNCFIVSPSGDFYYGGTYKDSWEGKCKVKFTRSTELDIGNWTCHFAHPDKAEDDIITVSVEDVEVLRSLTSNVEVQEEERLEIMCEIDVSIESCRFINSQGSIYFVSPRWSTEDISYTGRGFASGDCGISISKAKHHHSGKWLCDVRKKNVLMEEAPVEVHVSVKSRNVSSASASIAVVAIAVVIILVVIASVIFVEFRRSRQHSRESGNSNESMNSMTIINTRTEPFYS